MAPNTKPESVLDVCDRVEVQDDVKIVPREYKFVWCNIILYVYLVGTSLYGLFLGITSAQWLTIAYSAFMVPLGTLGITCGAHRLWAHRSYKAKTPLKIFLVIIQTLAFQMSVIDWARDHRVHHKYSETDADPHNAKRGFFFSHVGWLLVRRHPEVIIKGRGIDISDLTSDPILAFQKRHYLAMVLVITFIIPIAIPIYLWGESAIVAFSMNQARYLISLNCTWLVNSAAHMFGNKPYDRFINPAENKTVSFLVLGEGWHNYHHTFPWDYRTGEYGRLNLTAVFIRAMARIGWATDLKSAPMDMIQTRIQRTGDGTHEIWGWGDKDQLQEDVAGADIFYREKVK